jgi:hypothetical protein
LKTLNNTKNRISVGVNALRKQDIIAKPIALKRLVFRENKLQHNQNVVSYFGNNGHRLGRLELISLTFAGVSLTSTPIYRFRDSVAVDEGWFS